MNLIYLRIYKNSCCSQNKSKGFRYKIIFSLLTFKSGRLSSFLILLFALNSSLNYLNSKKWLIGQMVMAIIFYWAGALTGLAVSLLGNKVDITCCSCDCNRAGQGISLSCLQFRFSPYSWKIFGTTEITMHTVFPQKYERTPFTVFKEMS